MSDKFKPKILDGVMKAPVRFTENWPPYNAGDTAWFPLKQATNLINQKVAKRPGQKTDGPVAEGGYKKAVPKGGKKKDKKAASKKG